MRFSVSKSLSPLLLTAVVAAAALPQASAPLDIRVAGPEPAVTRPASGEVVRTPLRSVAVPVVAVHAAAEGRSAVVRRAEASGVRPFTMIGVTWAGGRAADVSARIRVRTGGSWQPWATPDWTPAGDGVRGGTDPLWVGTSDGYQVEVATSGGKAARGVRVLLLNPTPTDAEQQAADAMTLAAFQSPGAMTRPRIVTREAWGADPSLSSTCSNYSDRLEAVFVHHTAGSNNYSAAQAPSVLRGIQAYHTRGQGWCDVGYNFLVDKFGTIYEGRRGGMDVPVMGAHVYSYNTNTTGVSMIGNYDLVKPTPELLESVARVIAWKVDTNYLNPLGKVTYDGERIDVISAHRDVASTACPGRFGYAAMGGIRDRVAALVRATPKSKVERAWTSGAAATVGAPYRSERKTRVGRFTDFSRGTIFESASGVRVVPDPFRDALRAAGWLGRTGWPTGDVTTTGRVSVQPTGRGAVIGSGDRAHWLPEGFLTEYQRLGGADGWLGLPTSTVTTDNDGRSMVAFDNGSLTEERPGVFAAVRMLAAVKLVGHGYGHGRGMSQWGAQGAALQGKDVDDIVGFYYPGTSKGRANGVVRVWVTADTSPDLVVRPAHGLKVRDLGDGSSWTLPQKKGVTAWRLRYNARDKVVLDFSTGSRWQRLRFPDRAVFSGAGEFFGPATVALVTDAGAVRYRGRLRTADRSGRDMDTVNVVGMNGYLRGVVASESPAYWEPAALQAQAVAARTYAAWHRTRARAERRDYDLCDTIACQVYGGVPDEHPNTDAAIRATTGHIRTWGGAPILAEFSASNGGMRVGTTIPYQRFGADPYDPFKGNPVRRWTARISAGKLTAAYPRLGKLTGAKVVKRDGHGTWGGRVAVVEFTGTKGTVRVSGDELRLTFGLRSTYFTLR